MIMGANGFPTIGRFSHSKYTLWEGGIHVPCLIKWQRHIPKGTFSNQQLITMDITASILAAAGITSEPSWKLDGQNLLPILTGTQKPQERAFFWRQAAAQGGQKAMRKGDWKYVRDRIELLFNLKDDPAERINLSYRYPEVLLEMRKAVEAWEKDIKDSNGY